MYLRDPSLVWIKNAKKVYYKGKIYDSIKSAIYHLKTTEGILKNRLREGYFNGFPIVCCKHFSEEKIKDLMSKDAMIQNQG